MIWIICGLVCLVATVATLLLCRRENHIKARRLNEVTEFINSYLRKKNGT
jgi:hypothetical protein